MGVTKLAQKKQSPRSRKGARKRAVTKIMKENRDRKKILSPEMIARYEKRKGAVEALQRGVAASLVAKVHNVPVRRVFIWLSKVTTKGMSGLHEEQRSGRPSKLTPEAMQWLYNAITGGSPQQYYLEFALWSLSLIRALIIKEYDVTLNKSTICRLMSKMGITPQVPLYQSYRKSPNKVSYYLRKRYPAIAQWAKDNGAALFFADESRVRADGHQGTTWAPIGETPVVVDSGDRFGVNMISAVSSSGAMFFECFEDKMNSERFIVFLKALRAEAKRPIAVIVDGGSYHKSKMVREFLKTEGDTLLIKLVILPAYSPELNPDEQVWNNAKREIGRRTAKTKATLLKMVKSALQTIQSSKELVMSFFKLPDTQYASGIV
jgi:transposase